MTWKGGGDLIILPSCDKKVGMNSFPDQDTAFDDITLHAEYKKIFMDKSDFLFSTVSANDRTIASSLYSSANRLPNDGLKSEAQIRIHVKNIKKFSCKNAIHVLIFGFDDIRFNIDVEPSEIATKIVTAYEKAADEVKILRINLWCTTIPEIGDLNDKFRKFNDYLRFAAVDGLLGKVKLFDLAAAALTRPNSSTEERHHILYSFFEHQLGMSLMKDEVRSKYPSLQDPNKYIVQKGKSEFIQEHVTPIVITGNAPSEDAAAVKYQQQNSPVQINTGNPIADMIASLYLRDNTNS